MENINVQHECEICLESDKHSPANRQLQDVWCCVDCIVELNAEDISKQNSKLQADYQARAVAAKTSMDKPEIPRTAAATEITKRPPTTNAKNLAAVLAQTMEGLLAGNITTEKAFAVCKVSSEAVKVMDLIWRMSR